MFVVIFKKKKQGVATAAQRSDVASNEPRMHALFKKTKESKKQKPKKQSKSSKSQKYVTEHVAQPQVYVNQAAQQRSVADQMTQSDISLPPTLQLDAPAQHTTHAPVQHATHAHVQHATHAPAQHATRSPVQHVTHAPVQHAQHATHASMNNHYPDSEYKLLYETTDSGIPVYPKEEYDVPVYHTSHEKSYMHHANVIDPITEARIFPRLTSDAKSQSCDFIEYEREPKNMSNKVQSFNIVEYESSPKYRAEIKHLPLNIVEYENSPNAKKKFRNSPLPKKQSKIFQMASQMKRDRDEFLQNKIPDNTTKEYQYSASEFKTSTPQQTYSTSSRTEFKSSSPEPKSTTHYPKQTTTASQNTAPSPNYSSSGYNSSGTNYSTSRTNTSSPGNGYSRTANNHHTPGSNRSTPDYKYSSYETKKSTPELKTASTVSPKPLLESEIVFNSTEMYSQEMTYSRKVSESSANSRKESESYETKKCSMSKSEKSTSTPNLRKPGEGLSTASDLLAKYGIGNGQRAEQAK